MNSHLLLGQRLKIRRILGISFPARRTKLVFIGTNSMPAESTNLIATRAGIEAQVVDLERFHAERTFGQVITAGIHGVHDTFDETSKMFSIKNTKHTHLLCKVEIWGAFAVDAKRWRRCLECRTNYTQNFAGRCFFLFTSRCQKALFQGNSDRELIIFLGSLYVFSWKSLSRLCDYWKQHQKSRNKNVLLLSIRLCYCAISSAEIKNVAQQNRASLHWAFFLCLSLPNNFFGRCAIWHSTIFLQQCNRYFRGEGGKTEHDRERERE